MALAERFWESKTLNEMNTEEWEALCDGCGKCCLNKFIDDDEEEGPTAVLHQDEQVHYTNIACRYLNSHKCECTEYHQRTVLVPDCIALTRDNLKDIFFMPTSCTYRRLHEGRGVPHWHPLLNGGKKSLMHKRQMSARNKTISELQVNLDDFEDFIVRWPLNDLD